MKKYFLDPAYKPFIYRLLGTISATPFIFFIFAILTELPDVVPELDNDLYYVILFGGIITGSIWGLYGTIRWILQALPDK